MEIIDFMVQKDGICEIGSISIGQILLREDFETDLMEA